MQGYGFDEYGNRWLTSRSTALPGLTGLALLGVKVDLGWLLI